MQRTLTSLPPSSATQAGSISDVSLFSHSRRHRILTYPRRQPSRSSADAPRVDVSQLHRVSRHCERCERTLGPEEGWGRECQVCEGVAHGSAGGGNGRAAQKSKRKAVEGTDGRCGVAKACRERARRLARVKGRARDWLSTFFGCSH